MILFQKTEYTDGLVNLMIQWFGGPSVDFIDGPYWAKMTVLCFYTVWVVLPFKILILTSALASVNPDYYKAARWTDLPVQDLYQDHPAHDLTHDRVSGDHRLHRGL